MYEHNWRQLMAAVAMQAVEDIETAHGRTLKQLRDSHTRIAAGKPHKNDHERLERWRELDVQGAVEFFRGGQWELYADVLDIDSRLTAGLRHKIRQVAYRARQVDEMAKEGVA